VKQKHGLRAGCAGVALLLAGCSLLHLGGTPRARRDGNLIYVSWGDQIMVAKGDAQLDTEEKIVRSVAGWARHYDAGAVLWRGASLYIKELYERASQRAEGTRCRRAGRGPAGLRTCAAAG
jgi:hypothetical protein